MFNSFLDGSKPSIESAAVANAKCLTASVGDSQLLVFFMTGIPRNGGILANRSVRKIDAELALEEHLFDLFPRTATWRILNIHQAYRHQVAVGSGTKDRSDASAPIPNRFLL